MIPTLLSDVASDAGMPTRRISRRGSTAGAPRRGRTAIEPPNTKRARGKMATSWQASGAIAAPTSPRPAENIAIGIAIIWSTSDTLDQMAGTRTLPSPRSTLSSMPPANVIAAPPKRTRANSVAASRTSPLAPIQRNAVGAPRRMTAPNASPTATLRRIDCPARTPAARCRPAPSARATADDAPAPMPPAIAVVASSESGNTSDTAAMASAPSRLTYQVESAFDAAATSITTVVGAASVAMARSGDMARRPSGPARRAALAGIGRLLVVSPGGRSSVAPHPGFVRPRRLVLRIRPDGAAAGHGHDRRRALQGVRALRRRLSAARARDDGARGQPDGLPLSAAARRLHRL